MILVYLFLLIVAGWAVASLVFWFSMLIDCINRKFDDKLVWLAILFFGNMLGAVLYYLFVKNKKPDN